MAVFLANEDVEQLISMRDCIDSVEQAYRELGRGRAWNNPRIHTYGQTPDGATHFLKVFTGTVPALGYSILRIDSTMERNETGHSTSRKIGSRIKLNTMTPMAIRSNQEDMGQPNRMVTSLPINSCSTTRRSTTMR